MKSVLGRIIRIIFVKRKAVVFTVADEESVRVLMSSIYQRKRKYRCQKQI